MYFSIPCKCPHPHPPAWVIRLQGLTPHPQERCFLNTSVTIHHLCPPGRSLDETDNIAISPLQHDLPPSLPYMTILIYLSLFPRAMPTCLSYNSLGIMHQQFNEHLQCARHFTHIMANNYNPAKQTLQAPFYILGKLRPKVTELVIGKAGI